ncbi:unnamed protein product [Prorocentrum cordatum]|uniref:Uncharacterized protein n=1 Tax=Prorocentrum cordatum TaxID=2364126 RepID=A0ABN9Q4W9_9DINO|nr:unnamed protein product [Polarella glacialis]
MFAAPPALKLPDERSPGENRRRRVEGQATGAKPKKGDQRKASKKQIGPEELRGLERMDVDEIQRIMSVVVKLPLDVTMRTRQTDAVTMMTFLIPESALPVVKSRAGVRACIENAQDLKAREKDAEVEAAGSISLAALAGATEGCLEAGGAVGAANAKKLKYWQQEVNSISIKEAMRQYPFVEVSSVSRRETVKIVMSVHAPLRVLGDCLVQLGAEQKIAVAPMNHLERVLQSFLTDEDV